MTTINLETKIALFRKIYELKQQGDAFIDSLPSGVREAFYDNEYTNSIGLMNDAMQDIIFGSNDFSICWFLYEWEPGDKVEADGQEFVINNIDEYINFIVKYEGFGE